MLCEYDNDVECGTEYWEWWEWCGMMWNDVGWCGMRHRMSLVFIKWGTDHFYTHIMNHIVCMLYFFVSNTSWLWLQKDLSSTSNVFLSCFHSSRQPCSSRYNCRQHSPIISHWGSVPHGSLTNIEITVIADLCKHNTSIIPGNEWHPIGSNKHREPCLLLH